MVAKADNALRWALALIIGLTVFRLGMQAVNATDLFVDEAQYWAWGQELDWGYFSKPPVIGWLIRGVTDLVGSDAAFWVRAPASVLHAVTAVLILLAAREFYDDWVAAWAASLYIALPLITVGTLFMSTDTVMLPFFALALWMYGRLLRRPSWTDAAVLGFAIGAGMMGKYAMMYFALCAGLAALLQPTARIRAGEALLAAFIALLVFAPNIWWNIANDGTTVRHVVEDNASWNGLRLHFDELGVFLLSQAGVFGPILFVVLLGAGFVALRGRLRGADLTLLFLCLPIVLFVSGQALMSRAYANWAATAYIAAPILVAALLQNRRRLLLASQGLNLTIALALPILFAVPYVITDDDGQSVLKRYLGRAALTEQIETVVRDADLTTVIASNRDLLADMVYRFNDTDIEVFAKAYDGPPRNFYEQELPYLGDGPVAYVARNPKGCDGTLIAEIEGRVGQYQGRTYQVLRVDGPCR